MCIRDSERAFVFEAPFGEAPNFLYLSSCRIGYFPAILPFTVSGFFREFPSRGVALRATLQHPLPVFWSVAKKLEIDAWRPTLEIHVRSGQILTRAPEKSRILRNDCVWKHKAERMFSKKCEVAFNENATDGPFWRCPLVIFGFQWFLMMLPWFLIWSSSCPA